MSPDTSWSMRRSCMMTTEADCARPPRWGSSPPGSETLEYLCFRRLSPILDHLSYEHDGFLKTWRAFHSAELAIVSGNLQRLSTSALYSPSSAETALANEMMDYWQDLRRPAIRTDRVRRRGLHTTQARIFCSWTTAS
jgi:hypothetical protein